MSFSVVDEVFTKRAWDVAWGNGWNNEPDVESTGSGRGSGAGRAIRKSSAPRRNFPASITEITTKIKLEKAVHALGTIEVCKKRQGELSAQLTTLEHPSYAFRGLGSNEPERDQDEQAVYDEERQRLAAILRAAQNELDELFGAEVGPPLNLQAAVQQRKLARDAEAVEAQMADMAMGDEPESPAPSFASTGNPRFARDQLAQQNRSESPPPAYRSIGADD